MACDAASILATTKCIAATLWPSQATASWALSVCNGGTPPPTEGGITTDPDGDIITDEDGNIILPD